MKARVTVTLKNGVLDPQGKAIEGALGALGFSGVGAVRQGFGQIRIRTGIHDLFDQCHGGRLLDAVSLSSCE